jgi:hypothetical protein
MGVGGKEKAKLKPWFYVRQQWLFTGEALLNSHCINYK